MPNTSQQILTEPENKLPEFTFDDLPPVMRASIDAMGWRTPMPVQATAVPYLLANRDMIVQSRTGSGKTGAFLIPLLMRIDPGRRYPQALILVPTRELAGQVYKEFEILSQGMGLEGALIYGGVGYNAQLNSLRSGAQIIIGTPGRVLDHIGRRSLNLDRLNIIVFDEADEMLSMGFYPDMRELRRYLPRDRSSWMFSATMPYKVQLLAREFLKDPEFLSLSSGDVTVSTMEHRFYDVPPLEKDIMLMRLIELENPDSVIIFCNTKMEVEYVATVLRNYGYNADQLSGDLDQKSRERAMARIRNGETRFLVATDVAARGIDISDLSHVIQYDVPKDPDSYVHRAGRTARAGNTGVVITFISNMSEKSDLKKIVRRYNIEFVELPAPTADEVSQRMAERLTIVLEDRFRTGITRMERERMKRFLSLAKSLTESEDESMLLAMLLDSLYHETFHFAPVPAPDTQTPTPAPAPVRAEQQAPRQQQAAAPQQAPRQQQQEQGAAADGANGEGEQRKKKRKRKKKRNRGGGEERSGESAVMEGQSVPAGQPAAEERKQEVRADDNRRSEDRRSEGRRDEERRGDGRRDEGRRDEERKGEARRDEGRRDEERKVDGRRDEGRRDEERKVEVRKDEGRRDEERKVEVRKDEGHRDEERKGEVRKDEGRRDEEQKGDGRRDEGRRDEGRRNEGRRDEGRRDDRRRDQAPRSDRQGSSGRSTVEAGDGTWLDSIQVIEPENFVEPERNVKSVATGDRKGGPRGRDVAPDTRGERRDAPAAEKAPKESAPVAKEIVKEKAPVQAPATESAPKETASKEAVSGEAAPRKTAKKSAGDTPAKAAAKTQETAPAESPAAPAKKARASSAKKAAAPVEEPAPAKAARSTAKKAVKETAPAEEPAAPKAKPAASAKKAVAKVPAGEAKAASKKPSSSKKAEGEAAPAKRRTGK